MLETIRFSFIDQAHMQAALDIRTAVFVKEQGVDPTLEYDSHEEESHHYLCYADGIAVGTGRWRETSQGIKFERYAVLSQYRNKGIGAVILNTMLNDLTSVGAKIYLHAQLPAVDFYRRHGFVEEGEVFYEAGIAHLKMSYQTIS